MKIFKFIIFLFAFNVVLYSQKNISPVDLDKIMQEEMLNKLSTDKLMQSGNFPVANAVESDFYFVGPGDKFTFINLKVSSNPEIIEISPENTLMIPRIGMITTKGLTLRQLREAVASEYEKRNPNSQISLSLYQSRNVLITINGNFNFPGTYLVPASYTVSSALKIIESNALNTFLAVPTFGFAYTKKIGENLSEGKELSNSGLALNKESYLRDIIIFRNDGSTLNADIIAGTILNDFNLNPYVKEGDRIFLPFNNKNDKMISITGAVNNPVSIKFKNGDKAGFLLKLAGGLSSNANKDDVKIAQSNGNIINYNDNIELTPGAIILANSLQDKDESKSGIVSILGNVNNPGTQLITDNNRSLKSIIEKAGGFNKKAYLPLAYILRKSEDFNQDNIFTNKDFIEIFQYSDLTLEDTTRLKNDIYNKKPIVSCDFVELFEKNNPNYDIELQDGDVIIVPSKPTGVYVFGQVNNPGFVTFKDNKNIKWYIEKAGGAAKGAKLNRARVIKAKTKVWVDGDDNYIVQAGDYVYIPRAPDNPPGTDIQTYNLIVTSVFALVTLLNFIVQFTKP